MKNSFVIIFSLFLATSAMAQSNRYPEDTAVNSDSLKQVFQPMVDRWREAYRTKDATRLSSFYAGNSEYISAHVPGYICHGHAAVIANIQKGIDGGGTIDTLQILSANSSYDMVTLVCRYVGAANGQNVDGRSLLVMKRIDGRWLIVTQITTVKE